MCFSLILFAEALIHAKPEVLDYFLKSHCFDCHDNEIQKGKLNLEALPIQLDNQKTFKNWVLIQDKVKTGEMPPKKKLHPKPEESLIFLERLAKALTQADRSRVIQNGRSTLRRLNRFEFENSLRDRLSSPWLLVADMLPEDGTAFLLSLIHI